MSPELSSHPPSIACNDNRLPVRRSRRSGEGAKDRGLRSENWAGPTIARRPGSIAMRLGSKSRRSGTIAAHTGGDPGSHPSHPLPAGSKDSRLACRVWSQTCDPERVATNDPRAGTHVGRRSTKVSRSGTIVSRSGTIVSRSGTIVSRVGMDVSRMAIDPGGLGIVPRPPGIVPTRESTHRRNETSWVRGQTIEPTCTGTLPLPHPPSGLSSGIDRSSLTPKGRCETFVPGGETIDPDDQSMKGRCETIGVWRSGILGSHSRMHGRRRTTVRRSSAVVHSRPRSIVSLHP